MTTIDTLNEELDNLFVQFASGDITREYYERESREILRDLKFAKAKTDNERYYATYWSRK